MTMFKKAMMAMTVAGSVMFLSGCGELSLPSFGTEDASGGEHFVYQGHDFGPSRDASYRQGVVDGCTTASGTYAKDHTLFKSDASYKAGWEHGRLHCGKSAAKKS
jgi:hypothetical protein